MIQIILLAVLGHRGCSGTYSLLEYVHERKQLLNCSYYFPLRLHCGLGRTLADVLFFFFLEAAAPSASHTNTHMGVTTQFL